MDKATINFSKGDTKIGQSMDKTMTLSVLILQSAYSSLSQVHVSKASIKVSEIRQLPDLHYAQERMT